MMSTTLKAKPAPPKEAHDPDKTKFSAFDKASPFAKVGYVIDQFNKSRTPQEFRNASDHWMRIRDDLRKTEEKLSCDDYRSDDRQLILDEVEDFIKKPVGLIISTLALVISFAEREERDLIANLKKVFEELVDLTIDEATGKATEKIGEKASEQFRKRVSGPLREALIQYLQKVSVRSRKHFAQIIDNFGGSVKALGKAGTTGARIFLTPSKIAPDLCGMIPAVDKARAEAAARIFKAPTPSSIPKLTGSGKGPGGSSSRG